MKNREKFRDEILNVIGKREGGAKSYCKFVQNIVIPNLTDCQNGGCAEFSCAWCSAMFAFWLDEEYVEPQKPAVDWSKVPVDTLVRVRDNYNSGNCLLRYFKGFDETLAMRKYVVWSDGATSKTAGNNTENWMYCELVEDNDENEQNRR